MAADQAPRTGARLAVPGRLRGQAQWINPPGAGYPPQFPIARLTIVRATTWMTHTPLWADPLPQGHLSVEDGRPGTSPISPGAHALPVIQDTGGRNIFGSRKERAGTKAGPSVRL